jgi:bile acid-coenzyme A ligase
MSSQRDVVARRPPALTTGIIIPYYNRAPVISQHPALGRDRRVPPKPIGQILTDLATEDPDRPAVTCGRRSLTRHELESSANRLARAYEQHGVRHGDRVTIALPNSVEFYEACFAVWKLGAVPQPVSWQLPDHEQSTIIELANPSLVVGASSAPAGRAAVARGFAPDQALSDDPLPPVISPAWKAMTSGGSTGRPKLIVTADSGLIDTGRRPMNMQPHQVQLIPGPLYHSTPFSAVYGLFIGQHLVVMEKFDAAEALRLIAHHRVSFAQFVPTHLLRMWRLIEPDPSRYDLSSLDAIWHLAAPCPPWLKRAWIDLLGPERVFELYSCTETIAMTQISGSEWLTHPGSVGRPAVGEMKVFDAAGSEASPGTTGEIYMRRGPGSGNAFDYVGSARRTLPGGWESVGDLGHVDEDGYVYLSDRRADMILTGGANVYPAEVESAILSHPEVVSCAVVGLPDDDLGERVHAVVQAQPGLGQDALREHLASRLVRYKVPRSFRFVTTPLRDDAGKVRRSAIRQAEIDLVGSGTP